MKIEIFSFTDKGRKLAERAAECLKGAGQNEVSVTEEKHLTKEIFENNDAIIFVGAAGIAVRMISEFLKDKLTDPAVLVVDEKGSFVIPILSGHVGGANELAEELAEKIGAIPVITTATDVENVMAIDQLAKANGLKIVNRDNIKKVSGGLLKGKPVNVVLSDDVLITGDRSELDEQVLGLIYQPIVVGLGMRKGKESQKLEDFFLETLKENNVALEDVAGIASIDVKKDEPALRELSEKYKIPVSFFTAEELEEVAGDFEASDFVKATVGVADVSARAAKALGERGAFVLKKKKNDGMTISIFKKYRRVTFEY